MKKTQKDPKGIRALTEELTWVKAVSGGERGCKCSCTDSLRACPETADCFTIA